MRRSSFLAIVLIATTVAGASIAGRGARARAAEITVDAPPSLSGVATRVREMDPQTVARALAHAGLEMPPDVHIVLADRDAAASRQSPSWVVGQAFDNNTIVIFPRRIGAYPYDSLESVVAHEIAHLALSARAGGGALPRWFHEGVAMSVESGWGLGSQMRLLLAAERDPAIDDVSRLFATEALPATSTAYLLSATLVDNLRSRHGSAVPGAIAARVAAGAAFDAAFMEVTGETPDQAADVAWRVYRGLRWIPLLTSPSGVWLLILGVACAAFAVRLRRRRNQRREWEAEEQDEDSDVELRDQGDMP